LLHIESTISTKNMVGQRRRLALPRGSHRAAQQDHRDRATAAWVPRLVLGFPSFFHQVYCSTEYYMFCLDDFPSIGFCFVVFCLFPSRTCCPPPGSCVVPADGRRLRLPVLSLSPRDGSIGGGEWSSTAGASSPVISQARHRGHGI
jgi:hypothetical protein